MAQSVPSHIQIGSSMGHDWGGIERYVAHLSQELDARGIHARVAAPAGSPLFRESGPQAIPLRLRQKYDPIALASSIRVFRRENPAFVVAHYSPDYLMPALGARIARVPTSLMTRHVAVSFKPRRAHQYLRLFDGFIAISETVERHLLSDGIPPNRIRRALSGTVRPQPTEYFDLGPGKYHVGVFGRLHWVKGQDVLIRAMSQVPEGVLHIFGRGPYESELRKIAAESGSDIRFHGYLSNVADALASVDLVVIPSIWQEAFGLTLAEAMALGKPIVAHRVGAVAELVTHEEHALLVASSDPEQPDPAQFAGTINRLLADRELAVQLGDSARKRFDAEFTIEKMTDRVIGAYRELLPGP